MPSINSVTLLGNLCADPELKYTTGGAPVCNLRMAINRKWKDKAGGDKEDVCFLTVVVWQKQAESCADYLKKGSPLCVQGRLQSRSWEKEGKKTTTLEVVAERVIFLGGKDDKANDAPDHGAPEAAPTSEDDVPF